MTTASTGGRRKRIGSSTADELRRRIAGRVIEHASLAGLTTYRVGGPADVLVEAESTHDLLAVAEVAGRGFPVAVVGRGSNLLVSDEGFQGIVLRLGAAFQTHERTADGVVLGGGYYLPGAAKLTARLGLAGFEFAAEIPGSFGGAVRMNAGAHGRSIADVLVSAEWIDLASGATGSGDPVRLGLRYRHSDLPGAACVTRGELRLAPGDPPAVAERIAAHLRWRREHQPGGLSAGSVFKNPPGDAAGRLIDAAGLKGLRVGGAEVSALHANFIVADQTATASDVWRLAARVRAIVRATSGIDLEPEMRTLGAFPQVIDEGEVEVEG